MLSWRSGRGLQWQPVKLWWTPCPRGLRQCWKIMVATQNIDTLCPIWTLSLRGVLTFVASGLYINGCVLHYFEGTAQLHCYTSCILTALHCNQVSFLQCYHIKRYTTIFLKCERVYSLLWYTLYKPGHHVHPGSSHEWLMFYLSLTEHSTAALLTQENKYVVYFKKMFK